MNETAKGRSDSCELEQMLYAIYMLKKWRNRKNRIVAIQLLVNRIKLIYLHKQVTWTTVEEQYAISPLSG